MKRTLVVVSFAMGAPCGGTPPKPQPPQPSLVAITVHAICPTLVSTTVGALRVRSRRGI